MMYIRMLFGWLFHALVYKATSLTTSLLEPHEHISAQVGLVAQNPSNRLYGAQICARPL